MATPTLPFYYGDPYARRRSSAIVYIFILALFGIVALITPEHKMDAWLIFALIMLTSITGMILIDMAPKGRIDQNGVTIDYVRYWNIERTIKTEYFPIADFSALLIENYGPRKKLAGDNRPSTYNIMLLRKNRPDYLPLFVSAKPEAHQTALALAALLGLPVEERPIVK